MLKTSFISYSRFESVLTCILKIYNLIIIKAIFKIFLLKDFIIIHRWNGALNKIIMRIIISDQIRLLTNAVATLRQARIKKVSLFGRGTLSYRFPITIKPMPLHRLVANLSSLSGWYSDWSIIKRSLKVIKMFIKNAIKKIAHCQSILRLQTLFWSFYFSSAMYYTKSLFA